jgi:hypothetical protein
MNDFALKIRQAPGKCPPPAPAILQPGPPVTLTGLPDVDPPSPVSCIATLPPPALEFPTYNNAHNLGLATTNPEVLRLTANELIQIREFFLELDRLDRETAPESRLAA